MAGKALLIKIALHEIGRGERRTEYVSGTFKTKTGRH